jgi:hypothetical protein
MENALATMPRSPRAVQPSSLIPLALALGASAIVAPNRARAQEPVELAAQVRAGVEYDDNALRLPADAGPEGDALARYFLSLDATSGALALSARQGGKIFTSSSDADTLLTQAALSYSRRLGPLGLALSLDLKDRTERVPILDYTRGGVAARVAGRPLERLTLSVGSGWRFFAFKPNSATSSSGPFATAAGSLALADAWSVSLDYSIFSRGFESPVFERVDAAASSTDTFTLAQGDPLRSDLFQVARAAVGWRGPVVLDAGYTLSINRSNSYGQDLVRHTVDASLTAPLPLDFFVSARGQLQRTGYDDPVLLDADFGIDEDNRNVLVASLARPILDDWDVELRYSLYTQEFGVGSDYRRQTLLLAVGYTYEDD